MIDRQTENELYEKLGQLLEYDVENLIGRKEWGSINFEEVRKHIEFAMYFADFLSNSSLEHITNSAAEKILLHVSTLVELLGKIDNFSLESGDLGTNRDKICSKLRSNIEHIFDDAVKIMSYLAFRADAIAENIEKLNNQFTDVQATHALTLKLLKDKEDEADQIVSNIRVAAASAGVATFTEEFNNEVSKLRKQSKMWLISTVLIAVLTATTSILFIFWNPLSNQAGEWDVLPNLVSKIALIVVLFTCTIWCGRIYRSLVHQATVNRHRALSLKTFQAFANATSDPYVKDAVLMAATKTIFASVPTGFVEQIEGQEQGVNFVRFGKSAGEKILDDVTQN